MIVSYYELWKETTIGKTDPGNCPGGHDWQYITTEQEGGSCPMDSWTWWICLKCRLGKTTNSSERDGNEVVREYWRQDKQVTKREPSDVESIANILRNRGIDPEKHMRVFTFEKKTEKGIA